MVQHLAFQTLQVFQRDIEEVATPAGWIQHAHRAQAMMEPHQLGPRLCQFVLSPPAFQSVGLVGQHHGDGLGVCPFHA